MTTHRVAFGLGANLGDAVATLRAAVDALREEPQLTVVRASSMYRTAPVGGPAQPDFSNVVVVADSSADPLQLLEIAHEIEDRFGRRRDIRWGPRSLDIDLLAVGDAVSADPDLELPHPRAHLRAFVLVPWAEVDPDFAIPGHGRVRELRDALPMADRGGVAVLPGGPAWCSPPGIPA